jgi:hypothetical protein
MEQSEIDYQIKRTADHIMSSDQTTTQKREQMYALQCAAIRLQCEQVIRPIYNRAIEDDGLVPTT